MADLGFLLSGCSPSEHAARLRELRALSLVYLGLRHPATAALGEAVGDPSMVDRALAELGAVSPLRRRRLLCLWRIDGQTANCRAMLNAPTPRHSEQDAAMRASYNAIQPYAGSREEARYNNRRKPMGQANG
jgi:hypothetical protein